MGAIGKLHLVVRGCTRVQSRNGALGWRPLVLAVVVVVTVITHTFIHFQFYTTVSTNVITVCGTSALKLTSAA